MTSTATRRSSARYARSAVRTFCLASRAQSGSSVRRMNQARSRRQPLVRTATSFEHCACNAARRRDCLHHHDRRVTIDAHGQSPSSSDLSISSSAATSKTLWRGSDRASQHDYTAIDTRAFGSISTLFDAHSARPTRDSNTVYLCSTPLVVRRRTNRRTLTLSARLMHSRS